MSLTPCNKWLARVSDAAQQALLPAQATLAAPTAHAHEAERESQQAQAPAAQRRHGLNGQANSEVAVRKRVNSVMVQFKKEMTINMMRAGTRNVTEIQGSKLLTDADFK